MPWYPQYLKVYHGIIYPAIDIVSSYSLNYICFKRRISSFSDEESAILIPNQNVAH